MPKETSKKNSKKAARFITFEGGEGVGKSTQVKHLIARLARIGIEAIPTREPGGTPKAEAIRTFILGGHSEAWGTGAEAILFAAARLDHVNELIAPNLKEGKWVICDRFHDSTYAYQGLTGGVEPKLIDALRVLALNGHTPALTIILDMDPELAFKRVEQRAVDTGVPVDSDRFERENLDWHKRLRNSFLQIAKDNPERCVVIPADKDEMALADAVWAATQKRFLELKSAASA
ncbi:MAG TPA: dTMP kinase [Devosia sp.]|nr:dTMP kinase [Devosia sp.]